MEIKRKDKLESVSIDIAEETLTNFLDNQSIVLGRRSGKTYLLRLLLSIAVGRQCIKACKEIRKYAYDICSNDYIRGDDVKCKLYCILEKYDL